MSNAISLLKANYCRAIFGTASISPPVEAMRLIDGLTTERPTPDTTDPVAASEATALRAIQTLSDKLSSRNATVGGIEWGQTVRAVELWIIAAS